MAPKKEINPLDNSPSADNALQQTLQLLTERNVLLKQLLGLLQQEKAAGQVAYQPLCEDLSLFINYNERFLAGGHSVYPSFNEARYAVDTRYDEIMQNCLSELRKIAIAEMHFPMHFKMALIVLSRFESVYAEMKFEPLPLTTEYLLEVVREVWRKDDYLAYKIIAEADILKLFPKHNIEPILVDLHYKPGMKACFEQISQFAAENEGRSNAALILVHKMKAIMSLDERDQNDLTMRERYVAIIKAIVSSYNGAVEDSELSKERKLDSSTFFGASNDVREDLINFLAALIRDKDNKSGIHLFLRENATVNFNGKYIEISFEAKPPTFSP